MILTRRALSRVDSEGKITLPRNIRGALSLKEQDVVELKVVRTGKANKIVISKQSNYRK